MSYNEPPNYGTPPPPPPGGGGYGGGEYGGGQYGGAAEPQQTSVMAIVSLVTGILGICCSGWFILSIAALIVGFLGRKEIRESGGRKKGDGLALAGIILGAIGIALGALSWILIASGAIDMNYYSDLG